MPKTIIGKLTESDIAPGQILENLRASERNPIRKGTFLGFAKILTRTAKTPAGNIKHYSKVVSMKTPGGRVNIYNDKESEWLIYE